MQLRGRELKLRLLDRESVAEHRTMWQLLCMFVPLIISVAACATVAAMRKKAASA